MTNPKGSHSIDITLTDAQLYERINQARKDERDTLIGECRLTQFKNPKTDFGDGWNAAIAEVIAKLQLKEAI